MSDLYTELLGLLGFPLAIYLLLDARRITKRGWYMQKDFRTVVSEFERPRLFAVNRFVEISGAAVCLVFGIYALWQLLVRFSVL